MFVSEETKGDDLKLLSDNKKKLKQEGDVQVSSRSECPGVCEGRVYSGRCLITCKHDVASLYRQASWFWRQFLTPHPLIPKQMAWSEN